MTFARQLEAYGEQPALILESGEFISYTSLSRISDQTYFTSKIPQGTLVAIECINALASIAGYLGALRNHYPVLLVDAQSPSDIRERLYAHFKIAFVLSSTGEWRKTGHKGCHVHPNVALLLSTSGSTGSSKLVRLATTAIDANALSIAEYLGLNATERPVTVLPIHYSYGLSVLNSHFSVGATVLLTSQPITSRSYWDFCKEHQATSFVGVPMTYGILRQLRFEQMELPSLKTFTQAGGRLAPELTRWFGQLAESRGWRFVVMYGQTEATARIAYLPPNRLMEKVGSIGIPIPGGTLDIIDSEGNVVETPGEKGELLYKGPNVMMGYASNPLELALPDTQEGILRTGDLGWRDNEGFFYIVGRLQRFIKVFGNRIGLDEVEAHLHEQSCDAAVTGRDDLLVVAIKGNDDAEHWRTHITGRYRLHHSVVRVVSVAEFPRSPAGKILYGELLEKLNL